MPVVAMSAPIGRGDRRLAELASELGRPPVLAYASTSLTNFERINADGDFSVDNLRCLQDQLRSRSGPRSTVPGSAGRLSL
jgi:hypothetical protein